ncbi:MAG TPA: addiction module protein [Thermoanaerobaculia bacterium]|jgi:putative addiction module component (TIGR02574 family)
MARTFDEVRDEAMRLSFEERSVLADELWESTLSDEEREVQEAWLDVAERRADEIRAGTAVTYPIEESIERVRAKLSAARTTARRG